MTLAKWLLIISGKVLGIFSPWMYLIAVIAILLESLFGRLDTANGGGLSFV